MKDSSKKDAYKILEAIELVNNEGYYGDTQQIIFNYLIGNTDNIILDIYAILIVAKEVILKHGYNNETKFDNLIDKIKGGINIE